MTIRPAYSAWPDYNRSLSAAQLVEAIDSTFRIIDGCLDRWTLDTRGSVIQRVFSHDVYHIAQLNEVLGAAELPRVDLWD